MQNKQTKHKRHTKSKKRKKQYKRKRGATLNHKRTTTQSITTTTKQLLATKPQTKTTNKTKLKNQPKPKLKLKRKYKTYIPTPLQNIPLSTKVLATTLFILVFLYPGHNYYQTLQIDNSKQAIKIPETQPAPERPVITKTIQLNLTAQSVVAQDVNSRTMLYIKNPNTKLYPASTTKIMTALVALSTYKDLDTVLTVRNEHKTPGHSMKLQPNEKITVRALLYGLLVESGNDSAMVLANNHPKGYDAFISQMNEKAKELGLKSTHYTNPAGLEDPQHYTTARDLAILASHAVKNDIFQTIMNTKNITVYDIAKKISHNLISTNKLLGKIDGVQGVKTGWTEHAGECLVTYIVRDGHPVITVILNSNDRFGETTKLINWIYNSYKWIND